LNASNWQEWLEKQDRMKNDLCVTDVRKQIWNIEEDHAHSFGLRPSLNVGAGNSPISATVSCDPLVPRDVVCVAEYLPFRSSLFGSIMFYSALDHLKNDVASLREAKRVLVPQGRILIMQGVLDGSFRLKIRRTVSFIIHGKMRRIFYDPYSLLRVPWWDENHMRHYTSKTLSALFRSIGMRKMSFVTKELGCRVAFGVFQIGTQADSSSREISGSNRY
jgi:SAM-dependent methyltransferase